MTEAKGSNPSLPLDGVRIVDFTQVMLGPCCTQMLADYGADVIKIERPGTGDLSRWSIEGDPAGLNNPVFASLNRNKRSAEIDLRDEEDRRIVKRLIETSDVVVSNFRPGVMERMGFGYEPCRALNRRIIYAVGTGFGLEGPSVHKGGQDVLAQAMSGLITRRQDASHPPSIYATAICDYTAGMHLVQAILLALLHREKTGEGQRVAVSLYGSMIAAQMQEAAMWMMRGRELNWAAMPLTGIFETADGALVMVGAFKQNPLADICEALELPDLSTDKRFTDFNSRQRNREELQRIFSGRFRSNSTEHWLSRLDAVDILCAPVRSLPEALADEQTTVNQLVLTLPTAPFGSLKVIGSPLQMSAAPVTIRRLPPRLGADTETIRAEMDAAFRAVAE
jgi:formyl-CoA transferase